MTSSKPYLHPRLLLRFKCALAPEGEGAISRVRLFTLIILMCAAICAITPLHAQPWIPTRNVEITVSSGAGGAADREARELQRHLQALPGMPAITVNNRPGGGGAIAWSSLNQHQGDAHWLATMNVALLTNHIIGASTLRYQDLTPLAILMREYIAVWTRAESPIKSAKELIARLKANPSSVSFGLSPALGNQNHIVLGMLAKAAGVDPKALRILGHGAQHRGLARAGRALEQDVATGRQRRHHQFQLAMPTDHAAGQPIDQRALSQT